MASLTFEVHGFLLYKSRKHSNSFPASAYPSPPNFCNLLYCQTSQTTHVHMFLEAKWIAFLPTVSSPSKTVTSNQHDQWNAKSQVWFFHKKILRNPHQLCWDNHKIRCDLACARIQYPENGFLICWNNIPGQGQSLSRSSSRHGATLSSTCIIPLWGFSLLQQLLSSCYG